MSGSWMWAIVVAVSFAFFLGSRWGRARERFELRLLAQRKHARETNR